VHPENGSKCIPTGNESQGDENREQFDLYEQTCPPDQLYRIISVLLSSFDFSLHRTIIGLLDWDAIPIHRRHGCVTVFELSSFKL
jgi:hypothetical protein